MGLDHGLIREIRLNTYGESKHKVFITRGDQPELDIAADKIRAVIEEVIRWRKENHIHKWFVDNIQNGQDDCSDYAVSQEQLLQFFGVISAVLRDRSKAAELLPTQRGFFFGSTGYDDYYFASLDEAKQVLAPLIIIPELTQELPRLYSNWRYWSSW